ncbi:MAG: NADH:ubiquinone reductase (Na(+)-transporting) subunit C [Mangrovibacterium sp.]
MDRNSNSYTFTYATVMVIVVAIALAFTAYQLKPTINKNIAIDKKQNILTSVNVASTAANAESLYAEKIVNSYVVNTKGEVLSTDAATAFAIDLKKEAALAKANSSYERQLPVFECNINGETKYILPLYGAGLWGPIWGYLALNDDMNTIYGANFAHQGETPGLGAEISTPAFQEQFKGKSIFDNDVLASIMVAKSNESYPKEHSVDAISGGTITSKGLEEMIKQDLEAYSAFLKSKKQ